MFKFSNVPPALFTQLGQSVFGGSILLITPLLLSINEQAVLFLFLSLGALSRLADMGFLNLVVIYSSKAKDNISEDYTSALMGLTFERHVKAIIVIFPLILLTGFSILFLKNNLTIYAFSWSIYVLALAMVFSLNFFLSFYEGRYDIRYAHICRGLLYGSSGLFFLVFSFLGFSIYSLGLSLFISAFLLLITLLKKRVINVNLNNDLHNSSIKKDFNQLSKKTFFSWLGGYFGTHGLVGSSYLFVDSIFSGMLGLTLNIFIFIQNLSNIFLVSKIPEISRLASTKSQAAFGLVKESLKKTYITYIILVFVFFVILLNLPEKYSNRLLGPENVFFISCGFLGIIFTYAYSIFVRAFQIEPFAFMSIATSLIGNFGMIFLAVFYQDLSMISFTLASIISFVWTYYIYTQCRIIYE